LTASATARGCHAPTTVRAWSECATIKFAQQFLIYFDIFVVQSDFSKVLLQGTIATDIALLSALTQLCVSLLTLVAF